MTGEPRGTARPQAGATAKNAVPRQAAAAPVAPGASPPQVPAGRKPRSRRSGGWALLVIAGILAGSGAIRLGDGIGSAFALEPSAPVPDKAAVPTAVPQETGAFLLALQEREALIAEQEGAIADRQKALDVATAEIDRKLVELEQAEADLSATLALADTAAEDDLVRLTTVYENMKPKEAARMFEQMAPEFAAGFLGRMKPVAAANVMAGLSPTSAYAISVLLAGRNALVPKN